MATNIPKKLGKYDVLDVVGRGGMGIVYKAVDPGIGRLVAIKMVTVGFANDPELLKRFYREAQSAGKLQHPNIVTVYDLGDQDGNPYMVMEFLEGESLEAIISSRRSVSLEQKLNIVIQVCNALNYAHQHGVIHRDIKPANIMVVKDVTVKIVDFGIARIGNENVTRPGQLMGSVPYMSPEQIKDKAFVDSRTDIFSVGILLYQFLTGALPYDGKDMGAILLKIIHEPPPPLRTYLSDYPPDLDHIINSALAKNPEERYSTADRLAFDLMRVQDELKREMVSEYLVSADKLVADAQWNQAKEQILQILRIDRQNTRASELLRKVEQQIQNQKRTEQARELRLQAEQAIRRDELGEALRYLDHAVELDINNRDLLQLRNSIAERKAKEEQLTALLLRAESARDTGDLEEAHKAVAEALIVDPDNREALALNLIIGREIAEQNKLKEVQGFLDEARKRIASRSFTGALEILKRAEMLLPSAPGIRELASLATSGQEQEKRRKQLEGFNSEIEEALNHDNFVLACQRAEVGLQIFPEDRGLLKLKRLAEKQRQAAEKRAYVEEQIGAARQLLDSAEPDQSLAPLEEALRKYPQEPSLISMLSVVKETLARRREDQRKADCIQRAKEAIRRKAYREAIETLEATRKEIPSSDLDDLLQFAQEEATNYATRQKIDAAAEQARQFTSADQFQSAIDLLEATLREVTDEELGIILEDARRRLQEFNQKVQESISTAERLIRQDRHSEALKFLESQSEQYGKSPEFSALLERARDEVNRLQRFSVAKENAREALSKDDFPSALSILQHFREEFGDTPDARLLQQEIEAARSRAASSVMEKALPDVRMLLMVRSYDSAEGILDSLTPYRSYASPQLREQYESLSEFALRARAQRAASESIEKENQARMSEQPTLTVPGQAVPAAPTEIDTTEGVSRSQLQNILGQVVQIGGHYQGNQKVQSAIHDLMRRLSVRIDALGAELSGPPAQIAQAESATPQSSDLQDQVSPKLLPEPTPLSEHSALVTQSPPQEPQQQAPIVSPSTDQDSDGSTAAREAIAAATRAEAEARQKAEKVRLVLEEARNRLHQGQASLALQILQEAAAQNPEQTEIEEMLAVARSRAQEQRIREIEQQADAHSRQGHLDQALSTLEQGLQEFPEAEALRQARALVSAAQERLKRIADVNRLRAGGELQRALELVDNSLRECTQDRDLESLKVQIESEIAERQRQEAIAKSTDEAQQYLRAGQTVRAIETLRRCETRFPGAEQIAGLLRAAEEQLRQELEINSIRTRAEVLERDGRSEEAVALLEKNLSKDPAFAKLLSAARTKRDARKLEESLKQAALLQKQGRFKEALELVQQSIRQFGSTAAAAALDRTLQEQIEAERRQKARNSDRDKLRTIEKQTATARPSKLKKLAASAQQIASSYTKDNEISSINSRVRQQVESRLALAAPSKPLPMRSIALGAGAIMVLVAGFVIVPRLVRVTTVPVEIRTDPSGASVRVGDRACLTPNCHLDLAPGQYRIEARLDGYQPAQRDFTVTSSRQPEPISLLLQPVPPPLPPPAAETKHAALGTLIIQTRVPETLVSVDGAPRGRTDRQGAFSMQLEARSYRVSVEKNGYRTPRDQQIEIASGDSRQINFNLEPVPVEAKREQKQSPAEEKDKLAAQEKEQQANRSRQIADLEASLQQDVKNGDFSSARQKAAQIAQTGGDTTALSAEIQKAEESRTKQLQYENSFQQAFQQYRQANDKKSLEAARNNLQPFAQGDGTHAAETRRYLGDINTKIAALDQSVPPPPPIVKQPFPSTTADDAAVREVIRRYGQAFEQKDADALRAIWPNIGKAYGTLKSTFASVNKITYQVQIESVDLVPGSQEATVNAVVSESVTVQGGKPQPRTDRAVFELRKSNGVWLVNNVR